MISKKRTGTILLLIFLAVIVLVVALLMKRRHQTEFVKSYSDASYQYECSQPIEVLRVKYATAGEGPAEGKEPVDKAAAQKYCHMRGAY